MVLTIPFKIKWWIDDNNVYNIYCEKYVISAYGKTQAQAERMFREQVYYLLEETTPKK